jgi:hypothetical protein
MERRSADPPNEAPKSRFSCSQLIPRKIGRPWQHGREAGFNEQAQLGFAPGRSLDRNAR